MSLNVAALEALLDLDGKECRHASAWMMLGEQQRAHRVPHEIFPFLRAKRREETAEGTIAVGALGDTAVDRDRVVVGPINAKACAQAARSLASLGRLDGGVGALHGQRAAAAVVASNVVVIVAHRRSFPIRSVCCLPTAPASACRRTA